MLSIAVLTFSVLLQLLAVICALRLIKLTGRAYSWIFISLALVLMMVRRIIPLYYLVFTNIHYHTDLTNDMIGLLLSFLMLLGIVGIRQIFVAKDTFADWLSDQKKNMRVMVPLNGFTWNSSTGSVDFRNEQMRNFEKDERAKAVGDASIMF